MLDEFTLKQEHEEGATRGVVGGDRQEIEQDIELAIAVESLTIAQCAEVADQIKQNLAQGQPTLLDLSNCQEADSAGIQLLVALQSDPATSLSVHWTKPSIHLSMKADRLGVQSWVNAGVLEQ